RRYQQTLCPHSSNLLVPSGDSATFTPMLRLVWSQLAIAFSALLPLVNPLGSALVFYGLVGGAPPGGYRRPAGRISINTVLFLLVIELIGAAVLSFFGISLPIVEVAGGLVLASMGWSLLNK